MRNDGNLTEEDNANWGVIEVSKITNKIIESLIDNLQSELSEDFFISFDSLIKIGKKAVPVIKDVLENNGEKLASRRDIFNFFLNFFQNDEVENPLVFQLYNQDFIARAKAIMQIEEAGDLSYLKYILPLVEDPDDSVRWAAINFLINMEQLDDPIVYKKLTFQMEKESNSVIRNKLLDILE